VTGSIILAAARSKAVSILYPDVVLVQPGQDWDGYNDTGPLECPTQGRILAQRQIRVGLTVKRRDG